MTSDSIVEGTVMHVEEEVEEWVDATEGARDAAVHCRSSLIPDAVANVGVLEALIVAEEFWEEQIRDADTLCFTIPVLGTDKGKLDPAEEEDGCDVDK